MTVIYKPVVHIEELGEQGRLPDGGITNIGGVEGPGFTVGGVQVALASDIVDVANHLDSGTLPPKHTAEQIEYDDAGNTIVVGADVQAALDSIEAFVGSIVGADAFGYEHTQLVGSLTWTIAHGQNTKRVSITIWDQNDEQVIADLVKIIDLNTVQINFNSPATGRAILLMF